MYDLYTQFFQDLTKFVNHIYYDYGLEILFSILSCVEEKLKL